MRSCVPKTKNVLVLYSKCDVTYIAIIATIKILLLYYAKVAYRTEQLNILTVSIYYYLCKH